MASTDTGSSFTIDELEKGKSTYFRRRISAIIAFSLVIFGGGVALANVLFPAAALSFATLLGLSGIWIPVFVIGLTSAFAMMALLGFLEQGSSNKDDLSNYVFMRNLIGIGVLIAGLGFGLFLAATTPAIFSFFPVLGFTGALGIAVPLIFAAVAGLAVTATLAAGLFVASGMRAKQIRWVAQYPEPNLTLRNFAILFTGVLVGLAVIVLVNFAFPAAALSFAALTGLTGGGALALPLLLIGLASAFATMALLGFFEQRFSKANIDNYVFMRNLIGISAFIVGIGLGMFLVATTPALFSALSLGLTGPGAVAMPLVVGAVIGLVVIGGGAGLLFLASGMRENGKQLAIKRRAARKAIINQELTRIRGVALPSDGSTPKYAEAYSFVQQLKQSKAYKALGNKETIVQLVDWYAVLLERSGKLAAPKEGEIRTHDFLLSELAELLGAYSQDQDIDVDLKEAYVFCIQLARSKDSRVSGEAAIADDYDKLIADINRGKLLQAAVVRIPELSHTAKAKFDEAQEEVVGVEGQAIDQAKIRSDYVNAELAAVSQLLFGPDQKEPNYTQALARLESLRYSKTCKTMDTLVDVIKWQIKVLENYNEENVTANTFLEILGRELAKFISSYNTLSLYAKDAFVFCVRLAQLCDPQGQETVRAAQYQALINYLQLDQIEEQRLTELLEPLSATAKELFQKKAAKHRAKVAGTDEEVKIIMPKDDSSSSPAPTSLSSEAGGQTRHRKTSSSAADIAGALVGEENKAGGGDRDPGSSAAMGNSATAFSKPLQALTPPPKSTTTADGAATDESGQQQKDKPDTTGPTKNLGDAAPPA